MFFYGKVGCFLNLRCGGKRNFTKNLSTTETEVNKSHQDQGQGRRTRGQYIVMLSLIHLFCLVTGITIVCDRDLLLPPPTVSV